MIKKDDTKADDVINIYFDIQNLRLSFKDRNDNIQKIENLSYDSKIGELDWKIKRFGNYQMNSDLIIKLQNGREIYTEDESLQSKNLWNLGFN